MFSFSCALLPSIHTDIGVLTACISIIKPQSTDAPGFLLLQYIQNFSVRMNELMCQGNQENLKLQMSCYFTPTLGIPGVLRTNQYPDSKGWILYVWSGSSSSPGQGFWCFLRWVLGCVWDMQALVGGEQ